MNKKDLRYIKTDKLIKETFLKCIDQTGYDKTSISDICTAAVISRTAFYLHFSDKEDLLNSIYEDLSVGIVSLEPEEMIHQLKKKAIKKGVEWYVSIVERHRELIGILLKAPTENFVELLYKHIMRDPFCRFIGNFDVLAKDLYVQLDMMYVFDAIISFTRTWLDHYKELPVENVKKELEDLCYKPCQLYCEKIIDNPEAEFINEYK